MRRHCECLVFTWFAPVHQGYLAPSYRVDALMKSFDTLVVSNREEAGAKLNLPENNFICLPWLTQSFRSTFRYYYSMLSLVRRLNPSIVVFLHTYYAPLALLPQKPRFVIWWNIHPMQLFPVLNSDLSHAKIIKNRLMLWLCFQGARRADCVMPVGEHLFSDLLAHGCPKEKNHIIYLGVDSSFEAAALRKEIESTAKDKRPLDLIYTGSVKKERGLDLMLDALKRVNADMIRAKLKIVGADGEEYDYCKKQFKERNMHEYLTVRGKVPGSEIPGLLRNADAGISLLADTPYYRYNPATKLFEYLAAGLPVLANNIQTHTLYIRNWENGVVFEYDVDSMVKALLALWKRQNELYRLSINALADGKKYLWREMESLFIKVVQG